MKITRYFLILVSLVFGLLGCGSAQEKPAANSALQSDMDQLDKSGGATAAPQAQTAESGPDNTAAAGQENPASNSAPPPDDTYRKLNEARQAGSFTEASAAAAELLMRNPNDVKVLNAMAVMAISQEKYDLARLYLAKVMEKDPNNSAANNNLGVIELKSNNLRLALVQFKKATEIDAHNRAAHANLGSIYLQYRNYPNAVVELESAVEAGDESPATLSNYGYALTGAGEFAKAQGAYEKALAKDETNIPIMLNYASLLAQHNMSRDKAVKLLNKIRFVAHEPVILNKVEALLRKIENVGAKAPSVGKGDLD